MYRPIFIAAWLVLPPLAGGCSDDSESAIDDEVVYGVLDTHVFLYGQNLVGAPAGAQDLMASCPLGGTAHIVGQTSSDSTDTIDLTYSLVGCTNAGSGYRLTLDGDLHVAGSFRSTGYKALATTSASLHVTGTVDAATDDVDETCALAVTDRGEDGQASEVNGDWCGRTVQF